MSAKALQKRDETFGTGALLVPNSGCEEVREVCQPKEGRVKCTVCTQVDE
jgi:hypothetical protein